MKSPGKWGGNDDDLTTKKGLKEKIVPEVIISGFGMFILFQWKVRNYKGLHGRQSEYGSSSPKEARDRPCMGRLL